jgi:lipopolysaccharide export system protein LptC
MAARTNDHYVERRKRLLGIIRRRSRFVKFSKVLLSFLILLILGLMTVLPLIYRQKSGIVITSKNVESKGSGVPVMQQPKFQGVDNNNQPYTITARVARQEDQETIRLSGVKADLTTKDKAWLALDANTGVMKLNEEVLYLLGNVQLFHDAGYEMHTERVRIDISTGNAFGDKELQGQGVLGFFRAQRFAIYDNGERMIFDDGVSMTILPDAKT